MRGVRWARSPARRSRVDSLPAPRASERCALGFTLITDEVSAAMISAAESVPLRTTLPAWRPTKTGIFMARTYQAGGGEQRARFIGILRRHAWKHRFRSGGV